MTAVPPTPPAPAATLRRQPTRRSRWAATAYVAAVLLAVCLVIAWPRHDAARTTEVPDSIAAVGVAVGPAQFAAAATLGTVVEADPVVDASDADAAALDPETSSPSLLGRVATALGADRVGDMTGGLVGIDLADGRIGIEVDTDAPMRGVRRFVAGLRQIAKDAAAHAHAMVGGRPDALLRIVSQNQEVVLPIDLDGDIDGALALGATGRATGAPSSGSLADPLEHDQPLQSLQLGRADEASEPTVAELVAELGDSVVLLVQGKVENAADCGNLVACPWSELAPELVRAGHRVVVLEEHDRAESAHGLARLRRVLAALDAVGVRTVDIVAQSHGAAVIGRMLRADVRSADIALTPKEVRLLRRILVLSIHDDVAVEFADEPPDASEETPIRIRVSRSQPFPEAPMLEVIELATAHRTSSRHIAVARAPMPGELRPTLLVRTHHLVPGVDIGTVQRLQSPPPRHSPTIAAVLAMLARPTALVPITMGRRVVDRDLRAHHDFHR